MNRNTELVAIESIIVADRLREDHGDIAGLAESIQEHGLIHPIAIDQNNQLIAGERRLKAMKSLGFVEVEARRWERLSETERRELELEENLRRKDLTPYERSKNLVELATVAEQVDRETGEVADSGCSDSEQPHRPQNAPKPGSIRRTAERIGVPTTTIHEAKRHVAASESYPFLQREGWKQYRAMEAAEALDRIPEEDRPTVAKMIDEPGVPPQTAIKIIRNLADKPTGERKAILDLSTSPDERDRSLAKTKAVELPPMPDGRAIHLEGVVRDIKTCIKAFPDDPEVSELQRIIGDINLVIQSIKERHQSRVDSAA